MLQSIKSERCKQLERFMALLLLLLFAQHSCHHLLLFWPFIAVVQMVRGLAGHWSTIKMVSEDNNNNCNNISNIYNKDNAFTCVVFAFLAWDILILFLALISLIFFVNYNSRAAKLWNYYVWLVPSYHRMLKRREIIWMLRDSNRGQQASQAKVPSIWLGQRCL